MFVVPNYGIVSFFSSKSYVGAIPISWVEEPSKRCSSLFRWQYSIAVSLTVVHSVKLVPSALPSFSRFSNASCTHPTQFQPTSPCRIGVSRRIEIHRSLFSILATMTRTSSIDVAPNDVVLSSKSHVDALGPVMLSFAWKRVPLLCLFSSLGPISIAQWYLLLSSPVSKCYKETINQYSRVFFPRHLGSSASSIQCNIKTIFVRWHLDEDEMANAQ